MKRNIDNGITGTKYIILQIGLVKGLRGGFLNTGKDKKNTFVVGRMTYTLIKIVFTLRPLNKSTFTKMKYTLNILEVYFQSIFEVYFRYT